MLDPSAGGSHHLLLGVEQSGMADLERESRVSGPVVCGVDVVPE